MSDYFILLLMIFLHIIDDYGLQQGCLSYLKQKNWWKQTWPQELYKNDYIIALLMHAFSWTFMIMLPYIIVPLMHAFGWTFMIMPPIAIDHKLEPEGMYYFFFTANMIIHAYVDHVKANRLKINLWTDQLIHISQIVLTWLFMEV